ACSTASCGVSATARTSGTPSGLAVERPGGSGRTTTRWYIRRSGGAGLACMAFLPAPIVPGPRRQGSAAGRSLLRLRPDDRRVGVVAPLRPAAVVVAHLLAA